MPSFDLEVKSQDRVSFFELQDKKNGMDCFWLRFHHKKTGCLIVQPTSHLSRISSATWMINGWKNHTPQWRVESSSLSITKQCTPKTNHKLIKCYNGFFFGEKCVFLMTYLLGRSEKPPNSTLRHTHYPLLISISMGGSQAGSAMTV